MLTPRSRRKALTKISWRHRTVWRAAIASDAERPTDCRRIDERPSGVRINV